MKNIIVKYKSLSTTNQIIIAVVILVLVISVFSKTISGGSSSLPQDKQVVEVVKNNTSLLDTKESKIIKYPSNDAPATTSPPQNSLKTYDVIKVIDGDTLDVSIEGKVERLRLIGINTPETVDPRKPVECFAVEASNKAKAILTGKKVSLVSDSSQGDRDKYDRLLRYVFLEDGTNFNLLMIKEGYAYEYTYNLPYKYQLEFKNAQKEASVSKAGLWGNICQTPTTSKSTNPTPAPTQAPTPTQTTSTNSCTIKGNISSKKEKIYHVVGCGSYNQTVIDESKGERIFCTEKEAVDAGWRKALNCN